MALPPGSLTSITNGVLMPQFTLYNKGDSQPAFRLFMGLNLQWSKKPKG